MCLSVYGEENGVDIFANFLRKEKREGKQAQTTAQLEAERQQNLMTIKKLQETLETAQQKEVQLKAIL